MLYRIRTWNIPCKPLFCKEYSPTTKLIFQLNRRRTNNKGIKEHELLKTYANRSGGTSTMESVYNFNEAINIFIAELSKADFKISNL